MPCMLAGAPNALHARTHESASSHRHAAEVPPSVLRSTVRSPSPRLVPARACGQFDQDGSGSLDYTEFCAVLDALPLQRTVGESPFGAAVSAVQSLLVLRSNLIERLSFPQLASAGRIIGRLRGAGFDEDDASRVVEAIFLSRSRSALRVAWDVLRSAAGGSAPHQRRAVSGGGHGGGGHGGGSRVGRMRGARRDRGGGRCGSIDEQTLDSHEFKKILPLMGEDLPLSRVERLFEEIDVDKSGTLDFDEFVQFVRRLKPRRGTARNGKAAGLSAFDVLTSVRKAATGGGAAASSSRFKERALRRAVPAARRWEAGMLLLVMRDFGLDDSQIVALLRAIYPPPPPPAAAAGKNHPHGEGSAASHAGHSGGASASAAAPTGGGEADHDAASIDGPLGTLTLMREAWAAMGGGELVQLPANPFDFRTRSLVDGSGLRSRELLEARAARWQCAMGLDAAALLDLLTLIAEALQLADGWPAAVVAPLYAANGEVEELITLVCETQESSNPIPLRTG